MYLGWTKGSPPATTPFFKEKRKALDNCPGEMPALTLFSQQPLRPLVWDTQWEDWQRAVGCLGSSHPPPSHPPPATER